jgi:exosortase/archaeosortase family protein
MKAKTTLILAKFALYISALTAISLGIYYIPNYYYLKLATAHCSAFLLKLLSFSGEVHLFENRVFLNEVEIVRQCTGIQVIAVFSGLILPIPNVKWKVKLQALAVVSIAVYVANIIRIVLELWLLYAGILPWSLAHEPLGTILGIISVAIFIIAANHYIPAIGEYIVTAAHWITSKVGKKRKKERN